MEVFVHGRIVLTRLSGCRYLGYMNLLVFLLFREAGEEGVMGGGANRRIFWGV